MLTQVHPKLPMRNKKTTRDFYTNELAFKEFGIADFDGYLMLERDNIQIHFFEHKDIDPAENYGQVYIRVDDIDALYKSIRVANLRSTKLEIKPWGQKEFAVLDPDNNLLTFGQSL